MSNIINPYKAKDLKYNGCYFIVCDDGDVHCFDKDGKEQKIKYIPIDCFSYDDSFKKIIIPDSVTCIEDYAFSYCSELTSVTIPDSVTSIKSNAFRDCTNLTSMTIPDSVTSIEQYAFEYCSNLTSTMIGNGVTNIGWATFWGCSSLKSIVFEGKTINQIKTMENYLWEIEDESIIQAGL